MRPGGSELQVFNLFQQFQSQINSTSSALSRYADKLAAAAKLWTMVEEYSAVWNLDPDFAPSAAVSDTHIGDQAIIALPFLELLIALMFGPVPNVKPGNWEGLLRFAVSSIFFRWAILSVWPLGTATQSPFERLAYPPTCCPTQKKSTESTACLTFSRIFADKRVMIRWL